MRKTKKIELSKDAPHWHKLWSVRLALLVPVVMALEAALPLWGVVLPDGLFNWIAALIGTAAGVARVIKQQKLSEATNG